MGHVVIRHAIIRISITIPVPATPITLKDLYLQIYIRPYVCAHQLLDITSKTVTAFLAKLTFLPALMHKDAKTVMHTKVSTREFKLFHAIFALQFCFQQENRLSRVVSVKQITSGMQLAASVSATG